MPTPIDCFITGDRFAHPTDPIFANTSQSTKFRWAIVRSWISLAGDRFAHPTANLPSLGGQLFDLGYLLLAIALSTLQLIYRV